MKIILYNRLNQRLIDCFKYKQYTKYFVDICDLHYISMGFPFYINMRFVNYSSKSWC